MTPWYRFLTDLGDRGGETAKISIRRAALAIRAEKVLIARAALRICIDNPLGARRLLLWQ